MDVRAIIHVLNNLTLGEFSRLAGRVREAREEVARLGHDEVVAILDEAVEALERADLRTFRRRIRHAVSRLGHLA